MNIESAKRAKMTRDYNDTAELLDQAGEVIDEVRVALRYTENPQGLGEWGGKIHATTFEGGDWTLTRKVRLSNDEVGDGFVQDVEVKPAGWAAPAAVG